MQGIYYQLLCRNKHLEEVDMDDLLLLEEWFCPVCHEALLWYNMADRQDPYSRTGLEIETMESVPKYKLPSIGSNGVYIDDAF